MSMLLAVRRLEILSRRRNLASVSRFLPPTSSPETPPHSRSKRSLYRNYSTTLSNPAWWNPFNQPDSVRDTGAQLGSSRTETDHFESPRVVLERKDVMLALLALEFRRITLEHPSKAREEVVDMSYDSLEKMDLDATTTMQLRHQLQAALQTQVVEIFQAMKRVDDSLPFDLDEDSDDTLSGVLDRMLQLELERTVSELGNPTPQKAPKGTSPNVYFEIRQGALETLVQRRTEYREARTRAASQLLEGKDGDGDVLPSTGTEQVSWIEADNFGYHETINTDRNQKIRHYQAINICRAAKMRDDLGYAVVALQSSIAGAGRGVFVDGYAKAGSILAFQPGEVWSKDYLTNLPVEVERQLEKNDQYQMSLRPDDYMIDSRKSPYTVLTGNNTNMMALGHVVNHPTPTKPPNSRCIMVNFTQAMDPASSMKQYIPNTYATPQGSKLLNSLWDGDGVDMHGMCLIATRDICNEEILYDYRLMSSRLPSWYYKVEDNVFDKPPPESDEKK